MSASGFVDEGSRQRQHRAAFAFLVFIVLLLLIALVASVALFGWCLLTHRGDELYLYTSANSSTSNQPDYQPEQPVREMKTNPSHVTPYKMMTSSAPFPLTHAQYDDVMTVSDLDLSEMAERLWRTSSERYLVAGRDYALHFQGRTNITDTEDRAPKRLFQKMARDIRRYSPLHRKFVRLLNSYEMDDEGERQKSKEKFLEELLKCETFRILEDFLSDNRLIHTDLASTLSDFWFKETGFQSSVFQRVFVGEYDNSRVYGLNNWIQFYLQERAQRINYQGYINKNQLGLLQVRFTWDGFMKPVSTLFVGTSPDFELALYTMCYLARRQTLCSFDLQKETIKIEYNARDRRFVIVL